MLIAALPALTIARLANAGIDLYTPKDGHVFRANTEVTFRWQSNLSPRNGWILYVFPGAAITDVMPAAVYEDFSQTSLTMPAGTLAPGEYTWYVVANLELGYEISEERRMTAYCPADFDQNGFINGTDFDLYIIAFEVGEPAADFDGDGFVNGADFDLFVAAFEAGC